MFVLRLLLTPFLLAAAVMAEPLRNADAGTFARAAEAYRNGKLAEAWRLWLPLAESGHIDAQFALGMLCERDSVWVDCGPAEALVWYERAARSGHKVAQFNLGNAYRRGLGAPTDETLGREWLARAAGQGLSGAAKALGRAGSADAVPRPIRVDDARVGATPPLAASPGQGGDFTLQLGASTDAAGLEAFARQHDLGEAARVLGPLPRADGVAHFVLVWGRFTTAQAAAAARRDLPPGAGAWSPWVRRLPASSAATP